MVKLVAATSPILLAATMAAGPAAGGQTPAPTGTNRTAAPQVTVVGCVARNGDVDIDKGTRTLNIGAGALALTGARRLSRPAAGGVPGTAPQDNDSGTIPRRTINDGQPDEMETTTFALTGNGTAGLAELVGRRVEIVGRLSDDAASPGTPQLRGTTGTSQGPTPVPGTGTREERAGESSAHPSAELRKLEVVSFTKATGACD